MRMAAVRAVLVNYACHCTVLKGGENFVHPDWAGDAATRSRRRTPAPWRSWRSGAAPIPIRSRAGCRR